MSEWSRTQIKTEIEIDDEFCALTEAITCGEMETGDIKPVISPEYYGIQMYETRPKLSALISQLDYNVPLSLRCRLCSMPNNDMIDIFSSLETTADILEKIEYSLPITVKDTDTLPKQICRFCLEELERCHRFRKTVAAAEKQLLAFEKLASMKLEETDENNAFSSLYNAQRVSMEYDSFDGASETNSEVEMNNNKSMIIPKAAECLRTCSVVLSILKTHSEDNSDAENGKRSSSNTENRSANLTTEVFDVERKASENNEESIPDSKVNMENPDDFARAHSRNQLLRCKTCAQTFKWKSSLTRHSKIHTGKGLHSCQYCEKSFYRRANLKRHAAIHSEERNYRCPLCDKSFKRPDANKRHVELVHLNNRP